MNEELDLFFRTNNIAMSVLRTMMKQSPQSPVAISKSGNLSAGAAQAIAAEPQYRRAIEAGFEPADLLVGIAEVLRNFQGAR